jgi:hypothetical protein
VARRLPLLAVLCAGAALALGACGLGPGPAERGGAELRVTRDFGQELLYAARRERVAEGDTAMRLLQSQRRVETRYGGGFVQSIDGLGGRGPTGNEDWFYFVNGLEGRVGAVERQLHPGDIVQWDFRRWDGAMSVPAIVGAFPEPMRSGVEGKRLPVRLECAEEGSRACELARTGLTAAGVNASLASFGETGGGEVLRVLVGPWPRLRHGAAAAKLAEGPRASGVFARFAAGGTRLELLDPGGHPATTARTGTGLVAATVAAEGQQVWFVTGLDAPAVERAAGALDRGKLRDRYAVAVQPDRVVTLPVRREEGR